MTLDFVIFFKPMDSPLFGLSTEPAVGSREHLLSSHGNPLLSSHGNPRVVRVTLFFSLTSLGLFLSEFSLGIQTSRRGTLSSLSILRLSEICHVISDSTRSRRPTHVVRLPHILTLIHPWYHCSHGFHGESLGYSHGVIVRVLRDPVPI